MSDIISSQEMEKNLNNTLRPEDRYERLKQIIIDKRVGSLPQCCFFRKDAYNTLNPAFLGLEVGNNGDIKLKKTKIDNMISLAVSVPIALEVEDDLKAYGIDRDKGLAEAFSTMLELEENKKFFEFLNDNCEKKPDFFVSNQVAHDPAKVARALYSRIQKEIIDMNLESFKGLEAFCVISPKHIQKIGFDLDDVDSWVALGKKKNITFYVNPLFMDDNVYIGLKGDSFHSSSVSYIKVDDHILEAFNPQETGANMYVLKRRIAFVKNPLKDKENLLSVFKIVDNPVMDNTGDKQA